MDRLGNRFSCAIFAIGSSLTPQQFLNPSRSMRLRRRLLSFQRFIPSTRRPGGRRRPWRLGAGPRERGGSAQDPTCRRSSINRRRSATSSSAASGSVTSRPATPRSAAVRLSVAGSTRATSSSRSTPGLAWCTTPRVFDGIPVTFSARPYSPLHRGPHTCSGRRRGPTATVGGLREASRG